MTFSLMIHGGAGMKPESIDEAVITRSLRDVLEQGRTLLSTGGHALDAVALCVRLLEDDPLYNAGRGAIANAAGDYELDAAIMDGKTLKAGAVAGVRYIRNPVDLARMVMDHTPHVLLAGSGAEDFARAQNVPIVGKTYFSAVRPAHDLSETHGTVGAVAWDSAGNLAAATSTGGWTAKMPGRIGDTPLIGSGTYADNAACAISCTGHGELFIRAAISSYAAFAAERGDAAGQAIADAAIERLVARLNGNGGVITIDKKGRTGVAQSSLFMRYGLIEHGGESLAAVKSPHIRPVRPTATV
jgi:beta-aspartyl-peptidase (threonine type)